MKLSGNKKNGRYVAGKARSRTSQQGNNQTVRKDVPKATSAAVKKKKSNKAVKIIIIILVIILALAAALYVLYKLNVKPPEIVPTTSSRNGFGRYQYGYPGRRHV